ncbi:hypothetical protein [Staphylococcus capitis]|uniref:Uncharacterized protein n=1 Tax=Staphylococcus capitis TaxID=29388 RepID=A0ABX1SSY9_STACP|nr:hypothetical protein [Staphylococcus capitis]NMK54008.1 hypothetical protein [Staphylococcus capitis]NMK69300.1 hypothetical protein [Staphylococcus capitis]
MNAVANNEFKDVFENDGAELNYRYQKAHSLKSNVLPIIKTNSSYATWDKEYKASHTELDTYDYIVEHISSDDVELLTGEEREAFLDENPNYDANHSYKAECIDRVLSYNNMKLTTVTPEYLGEMLMNDMVTHGSVKEYLLDEAFINTLLEEGFVEIKLQSPFK